SLAPRAPTRDPPGLRRHRLESHARRGGGRARRRSACFCPWEGRSRRRPRRHRALAAPDSPRADLLAALSTEVRVVSGGRVTLRDGRTLAWCEYGVPDGRPVLQFQGTPGSRFSRYAHEESYVRLGARVIVFDRPGYGASTRLPGRGISV